MANRTRIADRERSDVLSQDGQDELPSKAERTKARVSRFLTELGRLPAKRWTLTSMATACGVKRTQFAHYCREITGTSPTAFLLAQRINRARRLLRTEARQTIRAIAVAVGFTNARRFSTVFRELTGMTPSRYRQVWPLLPPDDPAVIPPPADASIKSEQKKGWSQPAAFLTENKTDAEK